ASRPRLAAAACAEGHQKLFPAACARHVLRAGDGSRSVISFPQKLNGGLPIFIERRRLAGGLYCIADKLPSPLTQPAMSVIHRLFDIFVVNEPEVALLPVFHF